MALARPERTFNAPASLVGNAMVTCPSMEILLAPQLASLLNAVPTKIGFSAYQRGSQFARRAALMVE